MKVTEIIKAASKTLFSFEILPPLKGKGMDTVCSFIDPIMEFKPAFINITSHREQYDQLLRKTRLRPGTVAISAAIKHRYDVEVIPHILCGGFTRSETEYALIDLNFLGIENILCLRGDTLKNEKSFIPEEGGNTYSSQLVEQVMNMNKGMYLGDTNGNQSFPTSFCCGVAGYPEKHYSAANLDTDIVNLKKKVDAGAQYIITQMFFDNKDYFAFVDKCRGVGIQVPIIPGLKPLALKNQVKILPELFNISMPDVLKGEIDKCADDSQACQVGTEWCVIQAKELMRNGVPTIHLFTYGAAMQMQDICKQIF